MSKFNSKLSLVLILQIILIGGIFWYQQQASDSFKVEPILSFNSAKVDRIEIVDDTQKSIRLKSVLGVWQLPSDNDLPVDSNKVSSLLSNLSALKTSWPVATQSNSHQRFEVAEDKFQRRVQLFAGDELLAELFLGTSPGFRKVHLRRTGFDEVYSVNLNTVDYPTAASDWLNKSLLSLADFTSIKGSDFNLSKQGENWAFTEAAVDTIDLEKAKQLAIAFNFLNVQSITTEKPNVDAVEIQLTKDNTQWTYHFFKDGDKYFVSRNDMPTTFVISQQTFDDIAGKQRQDLLQVEATLEVDTTNSQMDESETTDENETAPPLEK